MKQRMVREETRRMGVMVCRALPAVEVFPGDKGKLLKSFKQGGGGIIMGFK